MVELHRGADSEVSRHVCGSHQSLVFLYVSQIWGSRGLEAGTADSKLPKGPAGEMNED